MIYLDYVATTPLNKEVLKTYTQLLDKYFANADSMYSLGFEVNGLMEKSRSLIAKMLSVQSEEIIFTSGASEANNTAIKGAAFAYLNRGKHIITSAIEHSSVDHTFKELEEVFGFDVDYISVDKYGHLDLEELKSKIRPDTTLVSIMMVNNEIGVINPISEISKIIKEKNSKTKFHCDMVQALGKMPIDLSCVDYASFSAHKIYGLKGSGVLYKKSNALIVPLINGGQQEYGLRGGTSNALVNIVFAKTLRLALENQNDKLTHVKELNQYLRNQLVMIDDIIINSPEHNCSPYVLNFSAVGYKPEVIVHDLESSSIYISTKSACSSKQSDASSTLVAMKVEDKVAISALRISFSSVTSIQDIDTFIQALKETLNRIKKQR